MSDQDPAARARPLVFNPQGFLVAILDDVDQAEQASAALAKAGLAETDLRVYTGQQILDSWERFRAERSLAQRVVGAVTDDPSNHRGLLRLRPRGPLRPVGPQPDDADADRAVRCLADHQVLHIRHYGQHDIHIR